VNGKYWDKPWSLVDGCTPCSPGCDHCWSAAMAHRFARCEGIRNGEPIITTAKGKFKGVVIPRPDRLSIPLKRRKPTVYAVWNDLFHENVPRTFTDEAYGVMATCREHTFLVLTKRHQIMERYLNSASTPALIEDQMANHTHAGIEEWPIFNIYHGLTVCNQQEADEKIPIFLQVPGKKFLSIEPMLGPIDFRKVPGFNRIGMDLSDWNIILGGETGPGARPMHPDWVRSVRDQCAMAGVPFFFKGWGEYCQVDQLSEDAWAGYDIAGARCDEMVRCGRKAAGRRLDGREHNDLPWRSHAT
jgi:protein gp37